MAQDEALLLGNSGREAPPALRFYGWQPAALSIGYAQDIERGINREAVKERGLDVVRRPTGGRGVLHQQELTYSLVASQALFPHGIAGSYRAISEALLLGLRKLGVRGELTEKVEGKDISACFLTSLGYEIKVNGKKIIGSAQRRRDQTLLQQGSILLETDYQALADVFLPPANISGESWLERMRGRVGSLAEFLGYLPQGKDIIEAVCEGFTKTFGAEFIPSELTCFEERTCRELLAGKYNKKDWPDGFINREP